MAVQCCACQALLGRDDRLDGYMTIYRCGCGMVNYAHVQEHDDQAKVP